jgi:hypothetical protein
VKHAKKGPRHLFVCEHFLDGSEMRLGQCLSPNCHHAWKEYIRVDLASPLTKLERELVRVAMNTQIPGFMPVQRLRMPALVFAATKCDASLHRACARLELDRRKGRKK